LTAAGVQVTRALFTLDLQDQFAINRGLSGVRPKVLGGIRFLLTAQSDHATGASVSFPQPLEMRIVRNPSGHFVFFGSVVLPNGQVRAIDPQGSPWTIRIVSDYYQMVEQPAPAAPDTFNAATAPPGAPLRQFLIEAVLAPGPAYPFPNEPPGQPGGRLRGALRNPDGTPVAGATVEALDATNKSLAPAVRTADDGQWVLVFVALPAKAVASVRFTYPDGTVKSVSNVTVAPERENNLPQTALRGQVRLRKSGVSGAAIEVNQIRGKRALTDSSGSWFYYFAPDDAGGPVNVTATLPDQSSSRSSASIVIPRATVVVPTFDF
jgi:hypothetical protein